MTTATPTPSIVVTVLMSCYNASRWLEEAIQSVLDQTYGDFEFIIVDDGSIDDTLAIIRSYAAKDNRIVVIEKVNTGLADSLNVGIAKARGEWIARLDADDISEPTRLEKQVQWTMTNPNLVFIGTGLTEIDECGRKLSTHRYPSAHSQLVRHLETSKKFPPHSSAFYRSDVVRSIGGYRPRIRRSEDSDLWLRLSEAGELSCLDEPLLRIRKHADQISHDESGRRQKIDSRIARISYWLRYYGHPDPVTAGYETFESFYDWVESRLDQEQLFEFLSYIARVKLSVAKVRKSPSTLFVAARHIVGEPKFLLRFLRVRLIGDMISSQLAREWMQHNKNTCSTP